MPKVPNDTSKLDNTPLWGAEGPKNSSKGPPKTHLTHHLDLRVGDLIQWTELTYGMVRGRKEAVGRRTIIATLSTLPDWDSRRPSISFKPVHTVIDHGHGFPEDVETYIDTGRAMRRFFDNFVKLKLVFKLETGGVK